jgi:hypothetical protein
MRSFLLLLSLCGIFFVMVFCVLDQSFGLSDSRRRNRTRRSLESIIDLWFQVFRVFLKSDNVNEPVRLISKRQINPCFS